MELPIVDALRRLADFVSPSSVERVNFCRNPHPLYITEEHCPPKRAPKIPRRE